MSHATLRRDWVDLNTAILASEKWEGSYRRDMATFRRLIRAESEMHASVLEYLAGLRERAAAYVDWSQVPEPEQLKAAAIDNKDDPSWAAERAALAAALQDFIVEIQVIGVEAGEAIYKTPLGGSLYEQIIEAAGTKTAQLVSGVTDTTRNLIQQSIRSGIINGENRYQIIDRIMKTVASPVRAEMIASTESVNAYQQGLRSFALETGAISKEWDSLLGACTRICAPVHGKTVGIDETFTMGNGREVSEPAAHTKCRCGVIYNYPQ